MSEGQRKLLAALGATEEWQFALMEAAMWDPSICVEPSRVRREIQTGKLLGKEASFVVLDELCDARATLPERSPAR